jgi:hypothetical protein
MKNLGERIRVGFGAREEDGTKLEPEQQPVTREVASAADVSTGNDRDGTPIGAALPLTISESMSALDAVEMATKTCANCANFRPDLWKEERRRLEATMEGRLGLNKLRAEILCHSPDTIPSMINGDELHDVEAVLSNMGVCVALSAMTDDVISAVPEASCPDGHYHFAPRAGGVRRVMDRTRDYLLGLASRK